MAIVTTIAAQRATLAGVLSLARTDVQAASKRWLFLSMSLRVEYFTEPYDLIYRVLNIYYRTVGSIVIYDHFVDIVKRRGVDEPTLASLVALFVELQNQLIVQESEFRFQVLRLKEITKQDRFTEALVETMDIMNSGKKVGNKMLLGFDAAHLYMNTKLVELGKEEQYSQALTNKDMARVLTNYADRKFGRVRGFSTGFEEVDDATSGGFQLSDLVFLAGYTSEGKTTLLNSLVDFWLFTLGLNVVLATAEHAPEVVQRKMVAIRSADPKYGGNPLSYKAIKEGRLSLSDERLMEQIIQDMSYNPKYGRFAIIPIGDGETTTSLFGQVRTYNDIFPVQIFGWDYIGYTQSEKKRNSDREEMGYVVRKTKVNASAFNNSKGLTCVSPFQVSRGKWETAVKQGLYTLSCMEETSHAEKAADVVWSVLQFENKTLGQLLKNRDGPRFAQPFEMGFDTKVGRIVPKPKGVAF